ncbi:filamentous hemagglutinin N-terminal domain-containing protein [Planktothrix sp. FACHB-1375]|uniref:Filamentous hemagglutinin N-terminal domain-containing protein n=1 Tax=Aerosakkonema funiforme FACHB-1375 TaxID=2949571 RepID=A0A926VE70_9CYAN|nr:filamentous hemagglutinin N-terminal domain-containing protein [Aerosakkonema funiforme FACHB-1375]
MTTDYTVNKRKLVLRSLIVATTLSCLWLFSTNATAQIVPDTTLPLNSIVIPDGNSIRIEGGTTAGGNLFHSFQEFSVPTGKEAFFNNSLDIQNIFSRVTGSNISNIDGLIRANGVANLFLINPNGIIFGQNAQLNIGGSFTASTADGITLGEKGFFSAKDISNSSLLSVQPGALFTNAVRNSPAQLVNRGNLAVAPGQNLTLQGDEVTVTGSLTALGGNLILKSNSNISFTDSLVTNTNIGVTEHGSIQLQGQNISLERSQILARTISNQPASDINVEATGNITISGFSPPDPNQNPLTQLLNSRIASETYGAGAGGNINVAAAQINLIDGGQISTLVAPQATGNGGKITVNSNAITAIRANAFNPLFPSGIVSYTLGAGRGGDVDIAASRINLSDGGAILSLVRGTGRGGDLKVNVSESVEATGLNPLAPQLFSGIASLTLGKGDSGNLNLSSPQLRVLEGAKVGSVSLSQFIGEPLPGAGEGNAGDVTVNATQVEVVGSSPLARDNITGIFNVITGSGNGGNLSLTTETLSIREGAGVASGVAQSIFTFGQPLPNSGTGNGGNLTVSASQFIEVIGSSPSLVVPSQLGTATLGKGNGGIAVITTPQLRLIDGGIVDSTTGASGNGGKMTIDASEIFISGTAPDNFPAGVEGSAVVFNRAIQQNFFLPQELTGNTGEITVNTQRLTIQNGGQIRVRHEGNGDAGKLTINADTIRLDRQGQINATTAFGLGGEISLNVNSLLLLRNGSAITATALGGAGNGGNLNINSQFIVAMPLENSDITANAKAGSGGRVSIAATGIFGTQFRDNLTGQSDITATSDLGPQFSGVVEINTPDINASSGLVELSANFEDVDKSIVASCAASVGNSFTITGNGGLPDDPTQALRGRAVWRDVRLVVVGESGRRGERQSGRAALIPDTPIVEATGWRVNLRGEMELVANASAMILGSSWYNPPGCAGR